MLIRTQDKKSIVNFDNVYAIYTVTINKIKSGEYDCTELRCSVGNKDTEGLLGGYSTEEKAIKVLDMIQKQYSHCVAGNIFMNGRIDRINEMASDVADFCMKEHINMQVFQMPQDGDIAND